MNDYDQDGNFNYMKQEFIDPRVKAICDCAEQAYIQNSEANKIEITPITNYGFFKPTEIAPSQETESKMNYIQTKSNITDFNREELFKYKDNSKSREFCDIKDSNLNTFSNILNPSSNRRDNNLYNKPLSPSKYSIYLNNQANRNNQYPSRNYFNNNRIINDPTDFSNRTIRINLNREKEKQKLEIPQEMITNINNSVQLKNNHNSNPLRLSNTLNFSNSNSDINLNMSGQGLSVDNKSFYSLSSSNSCCLECEIRNLIVNKGVYNKELNENYKKNNIINNVLLQARGYIEKNKFEKAYNYLKTYIENNLYHPDVFYLYGESCRNIKYMEEAEKYLLSALNFENFSPLVYYSLGLLYMEVTQYKYSNAFFKKYLYHVMDNANIHFLMGKNYYNMGKLLKSLDQFSKSIELDPRVHIYYKARAEIYKLLSMKDLAEKDIQMSQMKF